LGRGPHNRWVLGDRAFPRGPALGVPEHCRGPVRSAGVPLGSPRYVLHMFLGGFDMFCHMLSAIGSRCQQQGRPQSGMAVWCSTNATADVVRLHGRGARRLGAGGTLRACGRARGKGKHPSRAWAGSGSGSSSGSGSCEFTAPGGAQKSK
jgi:hypothetical protein